MFGAILILQKNFTSFFSHLAKVSGEKDTYLIHTSKKIRLRRLQHIFSLLRIFYVSKLFRLRRNFSRLLFLIFYVAFTPYFLRCVCSSVLSGAGFPPRGRGGAVAGKYFQPRHI